MKHKRVAIALSVPKLLSYVVVIAMVGLVGAHQVRFSSAASAYDHNPLGYADGCSLVSGSTTLFGWAADPDAPAGSNPYVNVTVAGSTSKVASSIANYRDADINAYIKKHEPGAPTSSIYGWKLSLGKLYQGTSYVVSGTVLNYGTGANVAMPIHVGAAIAGNAGFASGNTIPSSCLTPKPAATPPPVATPPPAATPPAKSTSTTSGTTKKTTTPKVATPAAPAAPAGPSSNADGSVATGTTSAVITIPAGNAANVHVNYAAPDGVVSSSDDQAVSGATATVTLTNLIAETDYTYQIVRTNSAGVAATAASAPFTTVGYNISLKFTNTKNKPVADLAGSINDSNQTSATTDTSGEMKFTGLPEGTYTVSYTYKGHDYEQDFDTSTDNSDQTNSDGSPATITLTKAINVDKLVKTAGTTGTAKHGSAAGTIIIVIILLLLVAGAIWFFLRRRRRNRLHEEYSTLGIPSPATVPLPIPQNTNSHAGKHTDTSPVPLPEHAGESLRDMVLESMRQQATNAPQLPDPAESQPLPLPQPTPPQPLEPYVDPSPPQPLPAPDSASLPPLPPSTGPAGPAVDKPSTHDEQSITISHDK